MKLFIDTANVEEIRRAHDMGLIDGVTTNPTLISKEGRDFRPLVSEICAIIDGPVSVEAVSAKSEDLVPEARMLSKFHENIVVKIPMSLEGLKAVRTLSSEGISTNMTLIFSPNQALLAAKAGATYTSPFIGRLDDASHIGMDLVEQIITIYDNYDFDTRVIVASIRNPIHVLEAALLGADIATIPYSVLEQLAKHPLTDVGMERFLEDWKKIPKK